MILANYCSCCSNICNAKNLPKICPKPALKTCQKSAGSWFISSGSMKTDLGRCLRSCCGQISGRCWADFSACKSATQCLQIGDPMFANRRPILDNKPCFQMFESVELSICNDTCKSLQLLFKYLQHQKSAQNLPETCPEDLSKICLRLIYIARLNGNWSGQICA